jgi:hypothetical protein
MMHRQDSSSRTASPGIPNITVSSASSPHFERNIFQVLIIYLDYSVSLLSDIYINAKL